MSLKNFAHAISRHPNHGPGVRVCFLGRSESNGRVNRWRKPELEYRTLALKHSLKLGTFQMVHVERTIWVPNMIAQHGIRWQNGVPPIRYDALLECLKKLGFEAHQRRASIHMPRIGCGLAGGKWEKVEPLIRDTLPGTEIFVYDLPK